MEAYCSVPIENCDDLKVKASVHWDDKKSCGARRRSARRAERVCVCVCACERERDFVSGLRQERDQLTRFLPQ